MQNPNLIDDNGSSDFSISVFWFLWLKTQEGWVLSRMSYPQFVLSMMKETTVAMLDMSKTILEKVSFDKLLFRKELSKAVMWLRPDEKVILKMWALATFGHLYKDVILDVYKRVTKM